MEPRTKGELAKELGLKVYDVLPQTWVDRCAYRGWNVVPHFVWSYDGAPFGEPYPLTETGRRILRQIAANL